LAALREAGVTRISLGVQSLCDEVLLTLGRVHSAEEARAAMNLVREAGDMDLGVDLLYGVPRQSVEDWKRTLEEVTAGGAEHVSAYALSVEEGTPLSERIAEGKLPAPDDDLCAEMYETAREALSRAGYEHYEISNFARPGHECRHNRRYWAGDEYLGVGCSAHSHRGGVRWNNVSGPGVYTQWLERGVLPVARAERLTPERRVGELLMLGLRRAEGVGEEEVRAVCGVGPREVCGGKIEELCRMGLLSAGEGRLWIPRGKWIVSNEALSQLVA